MSKKTAPTTAPDPAPARPWRSKPADPPALASAQDDQHADALRRLDELAQVAPTPPRAREPARLAFPRESAPDFLRPAQGAQTH